MNRKIWLFVLSRSKRENRCISSVCCMNSTRSSTFICKCTSHEDPFPMVCSRRNFLCISSNLDPKASVSIKSFSLYSLHWLNVPLSMPRVTILREHAITSEHNFQTDITHQSSTHKSSKPTPSHHSPHHPSQPSMPPTRVVPPHLSPDER